MASHTCLNCEQRFRLEDYIECNGCCPNCEWRSFEDENIN